MKVLITGSLGSIGSQVIPLFPDRFDLVLTDLGEGEVAGRHVSALDITDYDAWLKATEGVDAILHLAITSAGKIITDPDLFRRGEGPEYVRFQESSIDTNLRGVYYLYEAARKNGVPRVVFGSSLTVYLGLPGNEPVSDDLPPRPYNFYAATKLWGEQLGEFYSRKHGLRVYCLRFGTPHPQDRHPQYQEWLQTPIASRTFVTYNDLKSAMVVALESEGPMFGAYTILSGSPVSRFDIGKAKEIGWAPYEFVERSGEITRCAVRS